MQKYIGHCIFNEFDTRRIALPSQVSDCELFDTEVQFEIKNKTLYLERYGKNIDKIRLNFFTNFTNQVLKSHSLSDLNFKAIVALGDLPDDKASETRLSFARKRNSPHICIPDAHLFQLSSTCSKILSQDIPFENKINKGCFFGSDTGQKDQNKINQRIKFCDLYRNSDLIDAKITSFIQGQVDPSICANRVSIEDQLKYKFIFNINGNTTSWDRLIWVMASNSICVFVKPPPNKNDICWYYHIFDLARPFPEVDELGAENFLLSFSKDEEFLKIVKDQQKIFAESLANLNFHAKYYGSILINYHYHYNGLLK
jgi:hypothetical protein